MKRIVAMTLALLLVLINLPLQVFAAGPMPGDGELPVIPTTPKTELEAKAEESIVRRGEELQVSLWVKSNEKGFNSLTVAVPEEGFELLSGENGELADGFDFDSLTFAGSADITGTGLLGTLTFLVTEDAPAGNTELALEVADCRNAAGEKVQYSIAAAAVYVQVDVAGISLTPDSVTLGTAAGENTAELSVSFLPEDATGRRVVWSFDNHRVIGLYTQGLTATVVGLKKGAATVTVASAENGEIFATCLVTVACSHEHQVRMGYVAPTEETPGFTGDLICADCGETLEEGAVIPRIMEEIEFSVTVDQTEVKPGDVITVTLGVTKNPGVSFLTVTPKLGEGLEAVLDDQGNIAYTAGDISVENIAAGRNFTVLFNGDSTETGTLLSFRAKVQQGAFGEAEVGASIRQVLNNALEDVPYLCEETAVIIAKSPDSITLNRDSATIGTADGENTVTLTATVNPADAYDGVVWTVTEGEVVSLSADGLTATVTGLKKGAATVRVTSAVNHAVYAECEITVNCSHEHQTLTGNVEATCTREGYTGDMVCDACGEIVEQGKVVERIPHTWVEKVAKDYRVSIANCQSPAVYQKSCRVCGTAHETETFTSGDRNPNYHASTHLEGAYEATEEAPGYTGDQICDACGKVVVKGETIPPLKGTLELALTADKTLVQAGEEVTVTVNVTKNPGVAFLTLTPSLTNGLELARDAETDAIVVAPGTLCGQNGSIAAGVNFVIIHQGDITGTGDLFSFRVKVAENAVPGSSLDVALLVRQVLDWTQEDVTCTCAGTALTVIPGQEDEDLSFANLILESNAVPQFWFDQAVVDACIKAGSWSYSIAFNGHYSESQTVSATFTGVDELQKYLREFDGRFYYVIPMAEGIISTEYDVAITVTSSVSGEISFTLFDILKQGAEAYEGVNNNYAMLFKAMYNYGIEAIKAFYPERELHRTAYTDVSYTPVEASVDAWNNGADYVFYGASLTLMEQVSLNFYMQLPEGADVNGVSFKVYRGDVEVGNIKTHVDDLTSGDYIVGLRFTMSPNVPEMNGDYTVKAIVAGEEVAGGTFSVAYACKAYMTQDAGYKPLAEALLAYMQASMAAL